MDCKQAEILMMPHLMGHPEPGSNQYAQFEAHLVSCPACAEEYQETRETIAFINAHKADFARALEAIESKTDQQTTVEQGWRAIEAKLDYIEAQRQKRKWAPIRRVAAVAACIMVAATLFLTFSKSPRAPISTPAQVASDFSIELLYNSGPISVAAGQQVKTAPGQLQTLIINHRHRVTMNANTTLRVYPYSQAARPGCRINLASGQILAHVQSDTGPFLVATAHGKAIITGTVFDIKAGSTATTLVVSRGQVNFQSPKGIVDVSAGLVSRIVGDAAPTEPVSCNAAELTAWATRHDLGTALAKIQPNPDTYKLSELWPAAISGPINLERINYQVWLKDKRDWFEKEFPWIFELQGALGEQGIELDYPRLLIESGDLRQFAYPAASPTRIPSLDPNSLLKTAAGHGLNKEWLLRNVDGASGAENAPTAKNRFTGLAAFQEWADNLNRALNSTQEPDPAILLYSLHAATYLANTRTLLWFEVKGDRVPVAPHDKDHLLALLDTQVEAANSLAGNIIQLLWTSQDRPCEGYSEFSGNVTNDITAIITAENEILQYDQTK